MNGDKRNKAARLFLERLINHSYVASIDSVGSMLSDGPPGRKPDPRLVRLHDWFSSLDEASRQNIRDVIVEAVDTALFGTLVLLDGLAEGEPIDGETSDFALTLQTYASEEDREANNANSAVRVNPFGTEDDLHDMYRWMKDERRETS